MVGTLLNEHSFKQKDQAVLMTAKQKNVREIPRLSPSLLFQRLLTVSKRRNMDEESSVKYELYSYPASLFHDSDTFRKPNKPELSKDIKWLSEIDIIGENLSLTCTYILDFGSQDSLGEERNIFGDFRPMLELRFGQISRRHYCLLWLRYRCFDKRYASS